MASNYIASYKRFNGTDWDTFYFTTLASQVSPTTDRRFVTDAQLAYLTNAGVNGGVVLLTAGNLLPVGVIPDLGATYLKKASPVFTGDLSGSSGSKIISEGGFYKEAAAQNGIKFGVNLMEFWTNNAKRAEFKATGELDLAGNRIENIGTPTAAAHAATKAYVDGLIASGVKPVTMVKAIGAFTTVPTTVAGQTCDGYQPAVGERVLLNNLTTVTDRGIYTVSTSGTAWAKVSADSATGTLVFVENGLTHNDNLMYCQNATTGTWIVHSKVDTYKAKTSGGLEKDANNEFYIPNLGVTNAMLAGSIGVNKIESLTAGQSENLGTAGVMPNGSISFLLNKLFSAIKIIRGTTNWNDPVTDVTINDLTGRIRSYVGSAAPGTSGYKLGDLYFHQTGTV